MPDRTPTPSQIAAYAHGVAMTHPEDNDAYSSFATLVLNTYGGISPEVLDAAADDADLTGATPEFELEATLMLKGILGVAAEDPAGQNRARAIELIQRLAADIRKHDPRA
ncbi:MAG: hypothetical protein JSV07_09290 [Acidimicrobiia bacterium]|jgi:hypothetical protein|nr:MAG: hypothetical protein JSV07_09290 [Acidimicrobiia bacterium]